MSIALLLPTRGRPNGLRRAISTAVNTAADPDSLSFMFRTDDDDVPAAEIIQHESVPSILYREFRGPRLGYARLFEIYNQLALAAHGDRVLLWNDDIEMVTPHWDALLNDSTRPEVQCLRRNIYEVADNTISCIDKRIVAALGGVSRHTYTDTWIGDVAAAAGVLRFRNDVAFVHHHPLHDQTHAEGVDDLRRSGQHERYKALADERAADVAKLKEMLAGLP